MVVRVAAGRDFGLGSTFGRLVGLMSRSSTASCRDFTERVECDAVGEATLVTRCTGDEVLGCGWSSSESDDITMASGIGGATTETRFRFRISLRITATRFHEVKDGCVDRKNTPILLGDSSLTFGGVGIRGMSVTVCG